ncbi:MAG TPA: serine hydrolase domain-containing protein [Dinghuibacter sp.]|uniref:serine hydrolase domain-containing protein n=1 Tax=Dinghuibacter sp. TaxID=2024697 RepID=UPI002C035DEC|nr:serine hydrolase domain-containing protein [Dinghuibacter sp.]HTJ10790.1 serine hydrolase domain-containing protein [Dinghuibacter sp.]
MNKFLIATLIITTVHAQQPPKERLDSFFRTQHSQIAFCILEGGRTLYANTTPADVNFRLASVTKQFTAMAVLMLARQGRLKLDDSLRQWLPDIPPRIAVGVTLRHLLTHSSGLPDYEDLIPKEQTTQVLDADVPRLLQHADTPFFRPGTRFRYSNTGFCLLALVIEKASGRPYAEYLKTNVFQPLGMTNTTVYEAATPIAHRAMGHPVDQSLTSATKGDGGIYTSVHDYARWIEALQANETYKAQLQALRFPISDDNYYAAGWFLAGADTWFHSGSTCGFNNFVIHRPKEDWTLVFLSNQADNEKAFQSVLDILGPSGFQDVMALHALTR